MISLVNGEVSEVGTYTQLMERNGPFAEFVRTHHQEESSSDEEASEGSPAVFARQPSMIDHTNSEGHTGVEEKCKDSKFIEEEATNQDQVSDASGVTSPFPRLVRLDGFGKLIPCCKLMRN